MPDRRIPNEELELIKSTIELLELKATDTDSRVDGLIQEFIEYKDENRTKQDELLVTVLENKQATVTIGNDIQIIVDFTKNFTGFVKISKMIKDFAIGAVKVFVVLLGLGAFAQVSYTYIKEHTHVILPDVIPNNNKKS